MGRYMDITCPAIGGLFQPDAARSVTTDRSHCPIHPYPVIDCHSDAAPAHSYCDANTDVYAFPNIHPRTNWLSKAARGLHAPRGQQLDDEPAHICDVDPRLGVVRR